MTPEQILAATGAEEITDMLLVEDLTDQHGATALLIGAIDNLAIFHDWLHTKAV